MPIAYKYSGYILGTIGLILIVILTAYCMNILLYTHYELCTRKKIASLTYPLIGEYSLSEGPTWMHKFSKIM